MSKLVRTTINPGEELLVSDGEYASLRSLGLVYGDPLAGPPDPDDVEIASILDDETSQTYQRLFAQLAANVDSGAGPLPDALRAAYLTTVGSAATPITNAATARPTGAAGVIWFCAAGVTPTNAVNGDLIWNA